MSASTIAALVARLKQASAAYYNSAKPLMTDDEYDTLRDQLVALDPAHPFLEEVGAPPAEGAVDLPFPMPSLDKIKPGQDTLQRFLCSGSPKGFLVSEKLDGLSALWMPGTGRLFLRGNGLQGQDVSHLVSLGIQGLCRGGGAEASTAAIRGELIIPRRQGEALARNWVNGIIHRTAPAATDVQKIRFIAYEVLEPAGMTRAGQFDWLQEAGYDVPWFIEVPSNRLTENDVFTAKRLFYEARGYGARCPIQHIAVTEGHLEMYLKDRRASSDYDTDGLVVAWNVPSAKGGTNTKAKTPKDCVAFKMPLADQSAETTVREVLWATSAQGIIVPKLRFDAVRIGAATIEFCTAHNARTVLTQGLGPGAKVVIRRSGDVIPTLDRVLKGAAATTAANAWPPEGTWEWMGDPATAVHIRATGAETPAMVATRLHFFLKTLEVPGAGPAAATALVEGGIRGPKALLAASATRLAELLGPKTGTTLYDSVRTALARSTELRLMLASSKMPRGVGETKLAALFSVEPDPRRWAAALTPPPIGWTPDSLATFLAALPSYEAWRQEELGGTVPYPVGGPAAVASLKPPAATLKPSTDKPPQTICMTGFRDKAVEAAATAQSHSFTPSVTGKTTLLLVPDGEVKESEKVKAARVKGIRILARSEFEREFLK